MIQPMLRCVTALSLCALSACARDNASRDAAISSSIKLVTGVTHAHSHTEKSEYGTIAVTGGASAGVSENFGADVVSDASVDGAFDAGGRLRVFRENAPKSRTIVRYGNQGARTIADTAPGLESNRIETSAVAFRAASKVVRPGGTFIVRSRSDDRGAATMHIEAFPKSESSSTYYGFLNDAEMQYDFAVRNASGALQLYADGGFAKGYDDPPPMRLRAAEPAWLHAANPPSDEPPTAECGIDARSARRTDTSAAAADTTMGTGETVRTATVIPRSPPWCVVVDDVVRRHFTAALAPGDSGPLETVEIRAVARIQTASADSARIAALLTEDVRRRMRLELFSVNGPSIVVRRQK